MIVNFSSSLWSYENHYKIMKENGMTFTFVLSENSCHINFPFSFGVDCGSKIFLYADDICPRLKTYLGGCVESLLYIFNNNNWSNFLLPMKEKKLYEKLWIVRWTANDWLFPLPLSSQNGNEVKIWKMAKRIFHFLSLRKTTTTITITIAFVLSFDYCWPCCCCCLMRPGEGGGNACPPHISHPLAVDFVDPIRIFQRKTGLFGEFVQFSRLFHLILLFCRMR